MSKSLVGSSSTKIGWFGKDEPARAGFAHRRSTRDRLRARWGRNRKSLEVADDMFRLSVDGYGVGVVCHSISDACRLIQCASALVMQLIRGACLFRQICRPVRVVRAVAG